jgi:hypothetical protein
MILDHESANYLAVCLWETLQEQGETNIPLTTMMAAVKMFIDADQAAENAF